jgi:hypothetical protein
MLIPEKDSQAFVIINFGAGTSHVSGNSRLSIMATDALYQQWNQPLSLRNLLLVLGAEIVENAELADYNLALSNLQKDTFINIFNQ